VLQEKLLSARIQHYGGRESSTAQSIKETDPDCIITSEGLDFKRLLSNLDSGIYSLSAGAFATW
jgi:hypothetical protein